MHPTQNRRQHQRGLTRMPRRARLGKLHGDRELPRSQRMLTFTDLHSVRPEPLAPFTGRLRRAVAAHLARLTGTSREHTESDLRCYLSRCAEHGLVPLGAQRPHLELYLRWMQEIRRFRPSTVSRRFSAAAGFYRTCVVGGVLEHSPAEQCAPPLGARRVAGPGVHAPAVRSPAHRRPGITGAVRLRPGGHARAARLADLRSHQRGHRRPRRGTRPPGAARTRQGHQDRPGAAPARGQPGHRPGRNWPTLPSRAGRCGCFILGHRFPL